MKQAMQLHTMIDSNKKPDYLAKKRQETKLPSIAVSQTNDDLMGQTDHQYMSSRLERTTKDILYLQDAMTQHRLNFDGQEINLCDSTMIRSAKPRFNRYNKQSRRQSPLVNTKPKRKITTLEQEVGAYQADIKALTNE